MWQGYWRRRWELSKRCKGATDLSGNSQGREIEIKLRCGTAEEARSRLEAAGFREIHPRTFERNEVFDTPELELRAGRKLLRLREYGDLRILTFKGPPEPGPHKMREEIETGVTCAQETRTLLARLGYQIVFRYEKYRAEFASGEGLALIDETPIGVFVELEGDPGWIDASAERLGYRRSDYITDSYGALYFAWCGERQIEPSNMEFPQP